VTAGRPVWYASWPLFVVMMIGYKILVDLSYEFVADAYGYQNLFYNGREFSAAFLSWFFIIFSIPILKFLFDDRSTSGNVLALLTLFSFIPTISAFGFRPDYDVMYKFQIGLFWLVFILAWAFIGPIRFYSLTKLESKSIFWIVAFILSASVLIYSFINVGFRLHFNLIDVYDIRTEARSFIAPFPINYLVSYADNILAVIAIFLIYRRKYAWFILLILIIFVNFSITGTKQIFFVPAIGLIGYFFIKNNFGSHIFLISGLMLLISCIFETAIFGSNILHNFFTYRVIFIPVELHHEYYQYFQTHDLLYYSQSLLKMFSYVEEENIQFLMGGYSIGDFSARANNGLFSDAYMNLGVVGVLIYPIILAVYLRILDGAANGLPDRIMPVIVIYVAFVLLGMTFTSALFTSGLLPLIFLLYSLPRKSSEKNFS